MVKYLKNTGCGQFLPLFYDWRGEYGPYTARAYEPYNR